MPILSFGKPNFSAFFAQISHGAFRVVGLAGLCVRENSVFEIRRGKSHRVYFFCGCSAFEFFRNEFVSASGADENTGRGVFEKIRFKITVLGVIVFGP